MLGNETPTVAAQKNSCGAIRPHANSKACRSPRHAPTAVPASSARAAARREKWALAENISWYLKCLELWNTCTWLLDEGGAWHKAEVTKLPTSHSLEEPGFRQTSANNSVAVHVSDSARLQELRAFGYWIFCREQQHY